MDAAQPTFRSMSIETELNGNSSTRPPTGRTRDSKPSNIPVHGSDENRAPPIIPQAFESMLRNTTETGDVGLFSIKPSRVPLPLNSPRKIGGHFKGNGTPQTFQPYGVALTDDRHRLPSYARDASSEIISMYERGSQKSASRAFEDPNYRSYSMTQTSSYSSYTLSNHRSYTSLKNHLEGTPGIQRPRSPFAYPTRLRRPGFRPSSPALTDGGRVDYSRRAEIDRRANESFHGTSSPASLYAGKRRPPALKLHPEGSRSTPSLSSQQSPPRLSQSPYRRHKNETPAKERPGRNGLASANTSPARSTLSLVSTMNLYQTAPALSTTITPGKIHPPSPLYYDYTEEFDVGGYQQPEKLEPPPQFRIERSIPEERSLSEDWPSTETPNLKISSKGTSSGLCISSAVPSILQQSPQGCQSSKLGGTIEKIYKSDMKSRTPDSSALANNSDDNIIDIIEGKKIIKLSDLGHGARELSIHVEEAFGLHPSPSFGVLLPNESANEIPFPNTDSRSNPEQHERNVDMDPIGPERLSSNSLDAPFLKPVSLEPEVRATTEENVGIRSERDGVVNPAEFTLAAAGGTLGSLDPTSSFPSTAPSTVSSVPLCHQDVDNTIPTATDRSRSSRFYSIDTGLTDLADLINTFEKANRLRSPDEKRPQNTPPRRTPMISPTLPDETRQRYQSSEHSLSPPLFSSERLGTDNSLGFLKLNNQHAGQRMEFTALPNYGEADVPNFSHQISRKPDSRSQSPMLAPKPISPARLLKLKNSVPHLMKALPPLPVDRSIQAISPLHQPTIIEEKLPYRFSPLLREAKSMQALEPVQPMEKSHQESEPRQLPPLQTARVPPKIHSEAVDTYSAQPTENKCQSPFLLPAPRRFRLKMRNFTALRPVSPPDSRPWNLEQSYPWANQHPSIRLPSLIQVEKSGDSKLPKFKLKLTRASNSTLGTVRINRASRDSTALAGLNLQYTKDLLTPSSGIDSFFRQVCRHLPSQNDGTTSNHSLGESSQASQSPISTPISDQISTNRSQNLDLNVPQLSPRSENPKSPTEVWSFFSDDTSHYHGGHGLRKRLSNLKSRMAVPYTSRNVAQSHDYILSRDRSGREITTPTADVSVRDTHNTKTTAADGPIRHFTSGVRVRKLRLKVSDWFKGARSAIATHVMTRSSTRRSNDDQIQLRGAV